jgi:arylsulfatase
VSLGLRFVNTGEHRGTATLTVDECEVGCGDIPRTATIFPVDAGLTCGEDRGLTVTDDYAAPFRFSGTITRVAVGVDQPLDRDNARRLEALMSQQ